MNNVTKKFETITQKAINKAKNLSDSSAFLDEIDRDLEIQEGLALAKVVGSKDIFSFFNNIKQVKDIRQNKEFFDNAKMNMYADMFSSTVQEDNPLNRDKSTYIADYSLSAKWKDMGLRLAAGIPQGTGLILDYAANHMNSAGKYLLSDTDKSYDEIFAKEQAEHNGFSKFANWITSPLDKQRAKINSQHLIDYDTLMDSYENEGLLSNLALTGSFALDLTPSVAETALMAVPGVGTARGLAALGATYLAEGNKEEQGKKLGKSANQIQGVANTTDALDIIGAAGQAAFAVPELMMLKHAAGVVKSPTRSVFDAINKTKAKQSIDEFVDNYALAPGKWLYKGAGLAARPAVALGSMATMEAISEVGQESFKKVANEDWWNKSKEENLQDLKESAVLGAIGGATLGGGLRAVTAPISYVANKAKEREIFETTKQNAAKLSKTLNIKDMFSSSIKETTDSKGNVHQTRETDNPLAKLPKEEAELRNNIFHNLSQVSLNDWESNPEYTSENSPLNVNKNIPLLNEVFSLGASGFLNNIQKDGREIPSQEIIYESIERTEQAVNEHIDSIIKTDPNIDTDGVISTLAEFKKKMENNSALDYYVARQMLTNPDQVKQLLARAIRGTSDISTQNEGEGDKLSSYENMINAAIKQGQKAAVKEYTQEQLNNLKKASKFISELTGIEELAEEFDEKNGDNSKGSAVVTVQDLLSKINKTIDVLSEPIDKNDEFQKSRNQILNTSLSTMLTGTKASTGEVKEGLAPMLKRIAQRQNEEKEFDKNGKTIRDDRASLKWWLNSHRAKYGLLTYILKDLKENKAGEAIYTVPKNIDASGEIDKVFKEVKVYRGRDKIISYLKTLTPVEENTTSEEVDSESISGSIAKRAKELIKALNNPKQNYIDDKKSLMNAVREFASIASGEHVFSTKPNNKVSIEDLFKNIRKEVEREGGAIKAALDLIDPSSSKMGSTTNNNTTTNNEEVTAKKDTQTTTQPKQEVKQDTPKKDVEKQIIPKQGGGKSTIESSGGKENSQGNQNRRFTLTQKTQHAIKDQLKANEANAYIGYGVVNSSTYTYMKDAEKAGIAVNENINPDKNTKAFVSVNGGNRKNIEENRQRALDTAIKVLEAGGQIIMDTTSNANRDWNKNGEGWVQNELKNRGYTVKEGKDFNTFSNSRVGNGTKDSSKDTDTDVNVHTSSTSKNTNNINNVKDFYGLTAGVEMDSTFENSDIDTQENNDKSIIDRIVNKAKGVISLAINGLKNKINKSNEQNELSSRLLNLNEILKPKDNPKSLLGDLNDTKNDTKVKEIKERINTALSSTFGFKEKLDINPFLTYFGALSTTNFLMSKDINYKNINNTSTLFLNDNVKFSATIRALEALTDYRFSYTNYKDLKEVSPNLKSMREIPSKDLDFLLRGIPLSTLAKDVGKKILSDVGLEVDESKATLSDANRIYQELGIAAVMNLNHLKLVVVKDVKYSNLYNNWKDENTSHKRVILNLNNVYTKEGLGNLSTAISFIRELEEDFKLDKSDYESTYSTEPFNVREFVKTKQGVFALTKKMYKAINAFLNTPFVVENHKDVKEFIEGNEKELKEFLGYIDLSNYVDDDRKLKEGVTPTILYGETGIKYSDIDSILGKNLQVENSINHLKDLLNDGSAATKGIYFNKTFSSGRLWLQSATVNPQSNKLHRFLVTLKTQTKTEKLNDDGNLSNSTYIAIAQAFGYKTDKETGAVNVGKAIVNTEGLKDKVIKALSNKGHIELGDGTKLEIEEIGHALNALFNIEKFLAEKGKNPNLTEFRHNIVEEVDGINNGIALKGLTFFVSPKTIKTLLSTGISFFGELKEKVMPEKFSAKATTDDKKANPDKAWDTYEEFAIVTSKAFKSTTELLGHNIDEKGLKLRGLMEGGTKLKPEDKAYLEGKKEILDVQDLFMNMINKFRINPNSSNLDTETRAEYRQKTKALKDSVKIFSLAMSNINDLTFVDEDSNIVSSVSKDARKLNKYIVIPSSYGSGLTSNIRSLTTFVVDNFGDWVLRRVENEGFKYSPEWGVVKSIFTSLTVISHSTDFTITYRDYNGVEQKLKNDNLDNLKTFVLNNADGIGVAKVTIDGKTMSLYDFINSHMEVVTRQGVKESRDTILPGYESVNNTINSVHNLFQIILTQKYDMLANEKLKERGKGVDEVTEDTPIPTYLLTIKEHKEILETLRKDFPSITVDSKERFGENKEARHVGRISMANMDEVSVSTDGLDIYYPEVSVDTGEVKNGKRVYKQLTPPFSIKHDATSIVFSSVGATPTAIMTQQKDGTDMAEVMGESADRNGGQLDINDIFDAILRHSSDGSSKASIISLYNRSQVNEALSSSQLYEQVALAAKAARDMSEIDKGIFNTVLSDKITNGINKGIKDYKKSNESDETVSPKDILVMYAKGLAAIMHTKYTISEVNKAVVKNLTTVASNMQNGHESDKAKINPERGKDLLELVKDNIKKGQDPKEYILKNLMLDITEPDIADKLSSIEDMLNSIYDNRIPNNTKHIPNGTIEKFKAEIKELQKLIYNKIENIRGNLKDVGAKEIANNLTRHVKNLGQGAFSLTPSRDMDTGRDKFLDNDEGRVASDNEIVEEVKEEEIEEKAEENNSSSSNSPTKNNEIKESKEPDTKSTKEPEPNTEYQGDMAVIKRLASALEKLLEPNTKKGIREESNNPNKAKENTTNRVEDVKNKINTINNILKSGFEKKTNLTSLSKKARDEFDAFAEAFKNKLETDFNVDEYLNTHRETYLKNLFKDIVGEDSIFDKINKEVLKSFENVDNTKVGDTSMDEFVSQIDLTTDKVSTTQEQMRNIDEANGRAMSKEFSNHLKGVLSELSSLASEAVNGVKVKYFKSKGKGHNEGEYLTNLREILIKEGIPLSKGNFTGTASLEETYGHELLHAITYYVIKAQAGGNPLTRELSMLHKRYLSVMTPSKLAKHINSGIPSKDLEVANRIIWHFENNTIEGLSEFIAIALSNEAVWNSLKDIEVKSDPNYDGMTFGERVVAKAMKMFNTFFNSIYRKYQDNDNMQKAMIALATKIATANSKAEYKIDKEMAYNTLEAADTLTTVANSLSSGLDKVDEVTSEKLNKLKDYVKSKGVKLVSVPKSRRRKYNSRWEEIRGLVAILASDVVGDKTAQAALSVAHDFGFHYNGVTQYVVSELSQMSDVKRKAEYLSRQRNLLDANRVSEIKNNTEALEEYFNTPLTLAENQVLGEGMLDTDLSSLLDHYSIDELPDILNNIESYKKKAYSDMLKEVDNNFKNRVGKYSKDDYKRYITNQSNSLAYFMNYQSYRNEVEGAIGVKNPTMIAMAVGTGANLKPNKKVVSAIDKYVTLAALEYLESDVKDLIVDKLRTEPKGMEAMMNYHRTNKAESLEKNFGGNPALMMKGYRYDVVEDYIDIKIAPVSEESLLKSQGFRRVSKEPLRKSSDDNSEERAIYINDFIPSTASFNQQAVSYLGHTGRGSKLSDIYNDKILKGADARTVEQEWYDSIVDLTKNSSLAARKLMSPNYSPANYKDKKDSENIMVPIFDEHGDLRDFAYLMSKKTKKDLLGLDTSLTKSLSHMSARTVAKYEAQKLNERVADELYKDYAEANYAERQFHFVEMSFESKDPYIREIYKMLEPSFKNYLEEKFNGKIMVRASTMLNFFGQRDMDYRNTAHYREKDVPYKKVLLASMDVARQVAKLAKMEIVLRFGSTIYNNFVSNGITLLIRGVPITSIVKDQIEGGRLLNKYLKDTKELKKLEAKKKAGGDVRDVEIENLKRELERNPIRDMMEFGLFSTIQTFEDINLDDKDNSWTARQVRKYTVENENIPENVREWMQKGYDWAFVTDRTVIGKNLTKLVQMGDFVARYALYKHYMRDNKMSKKEALEKVSDEFINYDLPVNKTVKFANDYGFLFFTRYYLVSQKVMAMLASDRPVSAGLVVGLQALFNMDFADIFDGNIFTKNLGELVSDPFTNLYRSLSPTGYDLIKGAYSRI
ncbi:hypothetical protein CVIC8964_1279 [Campylobacter vicugnae]|uniref:Uncharacterized protein n=1 Tax=Campylobacter vicugnae TaxID=1660076 RepID=A0A1X9T2E5_9BACT|nr:hypothetical protein [Campylobacter sp. RM8964]ARR02668.1 hypothetical protein CVIC8964_1279 [Campylobacter sp. RM8964]